MSGAAGNAADCQLVSTRVLNASREQVFRVFREPNHLARWWGPNDFRSTIHEFDFRVGARWELTLHGPDGTDYKNEYFILQIVEPDRIVISHPDPAHDFQLSVTLAEEGAKKMRLTWCQTFSSREHFEQVRSFVAEANEQVLDRLEAEAAQVA
ncbi:MAG TPA: SRPBCC domain-containing protein [Chthoniobacterales bacterium]|nr:SRPBCC domain-containing protein [Chthoniobacterales bacterium]